MFSVTTSALFLAFAAHASAHLSLLNIYGSNNVVGHAFGVDLTGKYPRHVGEPGDAGGDCTVFETGTDNPSPACGDTPELGPLDIPAWLSQAEGYGLPAAYPNMSVVAEAFQVNRDGGGPMSCEYSEDATATSWKPMFMSLNQAGNSGILNVLRENSTIVTNFPQGAKCTGGWTGTACIVRCRTGVNNRFGGCFAVKLSGSSSPVSGNAPSPPTLATNIRARLSEDQLDSLAQQIVIQMKGDGLLIDSNAVDRSFSSGSDSSSAAPVQTRTVARGPKSHKKTHKKHKSSKH